jgi:hypothetical protein
VLVVALSENEEREHHVKGHASPWRIEGGAKVGQKPITIFNLFIHAGI